MKMFPGTFNASRKRYGFDSPETRRTKSSARKVSCFFVAQHRSVLADCGGIRKGVPAPGPVCQPHSLPPHLTVGVVVIQNPPGAIMAFVIADLQDLISQAKPNPTFDLAAQLAILVAALEDDEA